MSVWPIHSQTSWSWTRRGKSSSKIRKATKLKTKRSWWKSLLMVTSWLKTSTRFRLVRSSKRLCRTCSRTKLGIRRQWSSTVTIRQQRVLLNRIKVVMQVKRLLLIDWGRICWWTQELYSVSLTSDDSLLKPMSMRPRTIWGRSSHSLRISSSQLRANSEESLKLNLVRLLERKIVARTSLIKLLQSMATPNRRKTMSPERPPERHFLSLTWSTWQIRSKYEMTRKRWWEIARGRSRLSRSF